MLRENLQDAGEIIQNILTQPLDIPGAIENISLLGAAKSYLETEGTSADLGQILEMFGKYPESTRILVLELEILAKELGPTGKEIA